MESRKKRKRLSSSVKRSCHFKNKNETEEFRAKYSDSSEENLDSVMKATMETKRNTYICTLTLQGQEFGVTAVDVKDFSDISYAPHFSSDIHVLLSDTNTVFCEKEKIKCSKKCEKKNSVKLLSHPADVTALNYANGKLLLSGSVDGTVKVWDNNYDLVASFKDTMKSLSDIHASSKLDHFATSSLKGVKKENGATVYGASLFAFDRKEAIASFTSHTSPTQCVRFHANGMYIATASRDGTIHMWSTSMHDAPVRTFKDEEGLDEQKRIEFSPDGKYLASTCCSTVKMWDLASGRLLRTLGLGCPSSGIVCFDHSGRRLATKGADGLSVWDIHSAGTEERHPVGRPLLRVRCASDLYTCVCG